MMKVAGIMHPKVQRTDREGGSQRCLKALLLQRVGDDPIRIPEIPFIYHLPRALESAGKRRHRPLPAMMP